MGKKDIDNIGLSLIIIYSITSFQQVWPPTYNDVYNISICIVLDYIIRFYSILQQVLHFISFYLVG